MAKHYQTFEHTADVGIQAWGDSLAELFEAMALGLSEVVCVREGVLARQARPLELHAEDVEALAVDFLSAVLNLMQAEHFLVREVAVGRIDEHAVAAELCGETYDPARHEILTEVKAVTYHQLRVVNEGGRWVGRVILDL